MLLRGAVALATEGIKGHYNQSNIFTKIVEYDIITTSIKLRGVAITVGGLPFLCERAFVSALLVFNKGGR